MDGYEEKTSSVAVPRNTGVDGFLKTLRTILQLPRVQSINIDSKGKVSYVRYVREGETDTPINLDYAGLEPWNIIRNGQLEELHSMEHAPATTVIATMFNRIAREGLTPIAFATGVGTHLWRWHERTSQVELAKTPTVYGLPIYTDRQMPDHCIVLCASFVRGSLIDCHRFISASMGIDFEPPDTSVSIL